MALSAWAIGIHDILLGYMEQIGAALRCGTRATPYLGRGYRVGRVVERVPPQALPTPPPSIYYPPSTTAGFFTQFYYGCPITLLLVVVYGHVLCVWLYGALRDCYGCAYIGYFLIYL